MKSIAALNSLAPLALLLSVVPAHAQFAPPNGVEATSTPLIRPHGVAYDASGNYYIADTDQNVIRKVSTAGIITTIAGTGEQGYAGDGGPATAAILDSPAGVAVDSNGNIYIADTHNNVIREVLASNGNISTIAGTGVAGFSGEGGTATSAMLSGPTAVAVDSNGNVYIADTNNHRIREITGTTINTVAGDGEQTFSGDGGLATAAGLDSPNGVAVDSSFNIYIGDTHNQRVRMVTFATGDISTIAGTGQEGYNGEGTATAVELARPRGVAVDNSGNVYFADSDNNLIRSIGGGNVNTIAGTSLEGFGGDSGSATAAWLDTPDAVAVSGTTVLLSDTENNLIRELDGGTINSTAGQSSGSESLVISGPSSVTYGAAGTLTATFSNGGHTGTGLVTFYDGAGASPAVIGSTSLSGNVASVSTAALALGTHSIVASYAGDANNTATASGVFVLTVIAGPAYSLQITVPPSATSGASFNFTVTAFDQFNNVATGYSGTVAFTSSDPLATLPASSTLANGTGTFSAKLATPGSQTITATDSANSLTITSSGIIVTAPSLVVNTAIDDSGIAANCTPSPTTCSLRDALAAAASLGAGNIAFSSTVFGSAQTITLTSGNTLYVPSNTTIQGLTSGSGATLTNLVTVAGGGSGSSFSVFTVNSGVSGASIANLGITSGNGGTGNGGGIDNEGALTVTGSSITGNQATNGGGVYNSGSLTISGSTLSGNQAQIGAGIVNAGGTLHVSGSTISGNIAAQYSGGIADNGTTTLIDSTISGNQAAQSGGGIASQTGTTALANSIVSGNTGASSAADDIDSASGKGYTDNGGNVAGVVNGNTIDGAAIALAPLRNYGGPTQTMVPLPGSAAICAGLGSNDTSAGITTDQRGFGFLSTYCPSGYLDAGSVQTNYALSFSQQPSNVNANAAISPAPAVSVSESGNPIGGASVSISAAAGTLSGTSTQTTVAGIATFSGLSISQAESNDTLTASLNLPPLSIVSNSFNVSDVAPSLTSPTSSPLGGPTQFTWNPGAGASMFALWIGTTQGSYNLYTTGHVANTVTSATFNVPANGATLHVRLWYELNGNWDYTDYTFTEDVAPSLTSPSSSPLGGPTQFTWNPGTGSTMFALWIGTTSGTHDVYTSGHVANAITSETVNIPANGATLYVSLWYELNGVWTYKSYTFTEAQAPSLTSPASSPIFGSTQFTWSPGTGASMFALWIGTSPGTYNYYTSGHVANTVTSETVNIPANGATLYVSLWYELNGSWTYTPYTFTEAAPPSLTSPTSSPLSGSTIFTWNPGTESTMFALWIGTTSGTHDVYTSGHVANTVTSETVNIPANGEKLYVSLWYELNGSWTYKSYTFTEAP